MDESTDMETKRSEEVAPCLVEENGELIEVEEWREEIVRAECRE